MVSKMENIPDGITGRLYRDCRKLTNLKKLTEKETAPFLLTQISSVSERQDSPLLTLRTSPRGTTGRAEE